MLQYDFDKSVGYWLCMASHAYERTVNERLAKEGITLRQAQVLAWLAHDGELSQTELADRMRVEPPTVVGVLDRMERDGYVARTIDPSDRRRRIVRPLAKTKNLWKRITKVFLQVRSDVADGLTPRESAALLKLLPKLHGSLAALAACNGGVSRRVRQREDAVV